MHYPEMRLGIDLMGADVNPISIVQAVEDAASRDAGSAHYVLFCSKTSSNIISEHILAKNTLSSCSTLVQASQVIEMVDDPLRAIRAKRRSTLVQGIEYVKDKKIDAFISCGNTGALIGASAVFLRHMPLCSRPGLLAQFPSMKDPFIAIDVGGLVMSRAEHLIQYAFVASAYQKVVYGKQRPVIGLLNVGSESLKGTTELRTCWEILHTYHTQTPSSERFFDFYGNIEGRDVFDGNIDVLLTSGFAGNIFLKTAEGIASFAMHMLEQRLQKAFESRNVDEVIQQVKQRLSYENSFGALVGGIDGLVIKCHGSSSHKAISNAIIAAKRFCHMNLIAQMSEILSSSQDMLAMILQKQL